MDKKEKKTVNLDKENYTEERENTKEHSEPVGKYPDVPYEGYPKPLYDFEKGNSWGSFICGVMSVVFCFAPIFPLLMSIIGLFLAHEDKKNNELSSKPKSRSAVIGTILSIFGIIMNIIIYVIIITLLIIFGTYVYNKYLC